MAAYQHDELFDLGGKIRPNYNPIRHSPAPDVGVGTVVRGPCVAKESDRLVTRLRLEDAVLAPWQTSSRVTSYLIEHIPPDLWSAAVPGASSRTIRAIAAHLHNSRRNWVRTLGQEHGIVAPERIDHRNVTRRQLGAALRRSSRGIAALLRLGCARGGSIPASKAYVWRNLPLDVGHVLAYFVAHEAHHRGQIVMVARQLNCRLPDAVAAGLWQWQTRLREGSASRGGDR